MQYDCLYKKEKLDKSGHRDTRTQRECHVQMKADARQMYPQAKKCQRQPANHQKLGERYGTDALTDLRGTNHADILISDFYPLDL